MKLKITQLNYGVGASGSASAKIYEPVQESTKSGVPYFSIEVGFVLCRDNPDSEKRSQEVVYMPLGGEAQYILVTFLHEQLVNARPEERPNWPQPEEYRNKLARLVANMVATAELSSLADPVPEVIRA